jgi:hypothetical protein
LRTVSHSDFKDTVESSPSELLNTNYILLGSTDGYSRDAIQLGDVEQLSLRKA